MKANKLWIVAKEVYRKNVKSAAFIMMTLAPILFLAIGGAFGYFASKMNEEENKATIAVMTNDPMLQSVMEQTPSDKTFRFDLDEQQAKQMMKEETLDGYLIVEGNPSELSATYYRDKKGKDTSLTEIEQLLSQYQLNEKINAIGLTSSQLASLKDNQVTVSSVKMEQNEAGEYVLLAQDSWEYEIKVAIAGAVTIIVFIFIMQYATVIAQEIASEKGSRIMEIVLSSVRPSTHFYGKIVGIVLALLTQLAVYAVIIGIFIGAVTYADVLHLTWLQQIPFLHVDVLAPLMKQFSSMLMLGFVYTITGLLTYVSLAGLLGSLVSRSEDVQKSLTPMMLPALIGYYIGIFAIGYPDNLLVKLASFIPMFTPSVMLNRVASESVASWEIVLSVIVSLVFAFIMLRVASVIYRGSALQHSDTGLVSSIQRAYHTWKVEHSLEQK